MKENNISNVILDFDKPWLPRDRNNFRLASKIILLTYLNYNGSLADLRNALNLRVAKYIMKEYVIVIEENKGTCHAHAYLELEKKLDTRSSSFFDFLLGERIYKANIMIIKRAAVDKRYIGTDAIEYCLKHVYHIGEKNVGESYIISPGIKYMIKNNGSLVSFNEAYMKKLEETQSITETMEFIKEWQPDRYFDDHILLKNTMRHILNDSKKNIPHASVLLSALTNCVASNVTAILIIHGSYVSDKKAVIDFLNSMLVERQVDLSKVEYFQENSIIDITIVDSSDLCLLCFNRLEWDDDFNTYLKRSVEKLRNASISNAGPSILVLSDAKPDQNIIKLLKDVDRAAFVGSNKTDKTSRFLKSASPSPIISS
jgi:hypothetical protein